MSLPGPGIDLPTAKYTELVAGILDVPMFASAKTKIGSRMLIDAMHVIFTLYAEFKNSGHFRV